MRSLIRFLTAVLVGAVGFGLCAAALAVAVVPLKHSVSVTPPQLQKLSELEERTILFDKGGVEMGRIGLVNRFHVRLAEIPPVMIGALLATEDRSFYKNPGYDWRGTLRAMVNDLDQGSQQGGSTLTQQLVKLRIEKSKKRTSKVKAREVVLAAELTQKYPKADILEEYLNTAYFGENSYGIGSAAERFFSLDGVQDLTLSQSALLAGVIRNPSANNPWDHPDQARTRRAQVLGTMVDAGYITAEQAEAAKLEPLVITPNGRPRPPASLQWDSYFENDVQTQLMQDTRFDEVLGPAKSKERSNLIFTGGLRVYTTYDQTAQEFAKNALDATLPKFAGKKFTGALASIDPRTGEVVALYDSRPLEYQARDANGNLRVNADGTPMMLKHSDISYFGGRATGSTFKLITLATALARGYSPNDTVAGGDCSRPPINYPNRRINGPGGTLRSIVPPSRDCAFVQVEHALGSAEVARMAVEMGVRPTTKLADGYLTLGVSSISPLEMATVSATLASEGIRRDPTVISRITRANGDVLWENDTSGVRVLTEENARMETDIMKSVLTSGTARGKGLSGGRVAAGKTGTTDAGLDLWFCGYTPQLSTCVWVGNPDIGDDKLAKQLGLSSSSYGADGGAPPWKRFMDAMLASQEKVEFTKPDPAYWKKIKAGGITNSGRGRYRYFGTTTTTTSAVVDPNTVTPDPNATPSTPSEVPPTSDVPPAVP